MKLLKNYKIFIFEQSQSKSDVLLENVSFIRKIYKIFIRFQEI